MMMFTHLLEGLGGALLPLNLLLVSAGAVFGMIIGIIPGLSAANGIALMLPVCQTFGLTPQSSLVLYAAVYYGTKYGSRISAILRGQPGDVSSQATVLAGYPLAAAGMPGKALQLTAISSFFGSLSAVGLIIFIVGLLPEIGGFFGPVEYAALLSFAFVLIVVVSSTALSKTISALIFGLMLSVVGLDWGTGVFRYSSEVPELYDGIEFIIVVIGVFAVSEALMMVEGGHWRTPVRTIEKRPLTSWLEVWYVKWSCLRAAAVGLLLGILPGAGPYVANLAAYRLEDKILGRAVEHKRGDQASPARLGRLVAPETANSSCAIAAFVPLLVLGIPGSGTTAVLLGALQQMNVDLGTQFIGANKEAVWILAGSMLLGNGLLLAMNLSLVRFFPYLLMVPGWLILPVILVISFVSVYAVNQSMISLVLMAAIGIFAYLMRKFRYPLAPLILGYVLGKPFEDNLRLALAMSSGDFSTFFGSPLAAGLLAAGLLAIILKMVVIQQTRTLGGEDAASGD